MRCMQLCLSRKEETISVDDDKRSHLFHPTDYLVYLAITEVTATTTLI